MEVKDKILNKADNLFRKFGIRGVTIDDICSECGISKKTIYQHYSDKRSIAKKAITFYYDTIYQDVQNIRKSSSNSIEGFFSISKYFRSTMNDVTPLLLNDLKKFHPKLYKITNEYKENLFVKTIRKGISRGKKEGYIRKSINEDVISKFRIESIEIGLNQDVFPISKYDFRKVQIELFDLFIRGMVNTKGLKLYESIIKKMNK